MPQPLDIYRPANFPDAFRWCLWQRIARQLMQDPGIAARAAAALRLRHQERGPHATARSDDAVPSAAWLALLERGAQAVVEAAAAPDGRGAFLRETAPVLIVLSNAERNAAIKDARALLASAERGADAVPGAPSRAAP